MRQEQLLALKKASVLCVEDEAGIREVVVKTLSYYFDEVYEASDGEEGFLLYEKHSPDIIISDIQMKPSSGIELAKRVREKDAQTVIFMLTAHSNEEYLFELINLNINHYILKPLNLKKLDEALVKFLKERPQELVCICKDFVLELSKRTLIYQNKEHILLRKREQDFLLMLYANKEAITTYEQMEEELWEGKNMTTHALKSFIKELRAKLPLDIIKNVPQAGYKL